MQFAAARDHRPAHHVAVAVDVLGGRVHDDVGAQLERLLPGRRQEGIVDHGEGSSPVGQRGDRADVGNTQQRIARCFDPHQRCRLRQRSAQRRCIAVIDELHLELTATLPLAKKPVAAAVTVVRRHDARADLEQVTNQADRCHARTGDDSAGSGLEIGQRNAQQVAGGIGGARIIVGALLTVAMEGVGRAQVDRRHHGAGVWIAHQPGAHRTGDGTRKFVGFGTHLATPH